MVSKERRKFDRVTLETKNKASITSLGSTLHYSLETLNISKRGLYFSCKNPERFPFSTSSIMEVSLDIGDGKKIFFNAKPVRFYSPLDNEASLWGPGLAVRIIQISKEEDLKLDLFLEKIAKQQELLS